MFGDHGSQLRKTPHNVFSPSLLSPVVLYSSAASGVFLSLLDVEVSHLREHLRFGMAGVGYFFCVLLSPQVS